MREGYNECAVYCSIHLANHMERVPCIALGADQSILQDKQHGQHDDIGLKGVLLLNAAHNEGVGIIDAGLLQALQLCGLPRDEGELAGRLVPLLLWHALHPA